MHGVRNLFAGKAVDVVRVLLTGYPKPWKLRDLSAGAGVSLRWAAVVANALIRERLATRGSSHSELKLMSPSDLLRRWANFHNFAANTKFVEYYAHEEDVSKLLVSFKDKSGPEYAVTCLAGALKVAPFVRPTNIHIYVNSGEDAKKWAELLKLMPIEENGNVKFAIAEGSKVFYGSREVDGVRVVSDVQLYVDLLNYPARGEEAAQAVLKIIEKKWKQSTS